MAVSNQFLNAQEYVNSMLLLVKNYLRMGKLVEKKFLPDVTDENGLTIYIKRPPRFIQTTGPTFKPQDIVVGSTSVAVTEYKNVHLSITDLQYVQSMNQLMKSQTMMSAASTLAQGVDTFLQTKLKGFNNWVNAPGAAVTTDYALATPQQFIPVKTRLGNLAVPEVNQGAVFSLEDNAGVEGSLIDKYMTDVAQAALKRGEIPMLSGIANYKTQNLNVLVTGTRTSTGAAQVDGSAENVNYQDVKSSMTQTLSLKGLTNGDTIKAGEVLTIAGVYAVNPRQTSDDGTNIRTLPYLAQFTVVEDVLVTGTTEDITITPPIIVPNTDATGSVQEVKWTNTAFATASAVPSDSANVVWAGAPSTQFTVRAAWHKSAIQLVGAQLIRPFNGEVAFATDPDSGLSIRYWRGSDFSNATHGHRWDMIYGATNVDGLLGARFSGTA
jgi:hypothetical protein